MAKRHPVVSGKEWLAARRKLLAKEKAFTRSGDKLAAERRALPWQAVEKEYQFEGRDEPKGNPQAWVRRHDEYDK